jgi:hypothetical protein
MMDGREGVRYFPRVGRPFPSIAVKFMNQDDTS